VLCQRHANLESIGTCCTHVLHTCGAVQPACLAALPHQTAYKLPQLTSAGLPTPRHPCWPPAPHSASAAPPAPRQTGPPPAMGVNEREPDSTMFFSLLQHLGRLGRLLQQSNRRAASNRRAQKSQVYVTAAKETCMEQLARETCQPDAQTAPHLRLALNLLLPSGQRLSQLEHQGPQPPLIKALVPHNRRLGCCCSCCSC